MILAIYILGLLSFWLIGTWAYLNENDSFDPVVVLAIPLCALFWPAVLVPLVAVTVIDKEQRR